MTDIKTLRAAIDRIDREIQGLFEERMQVAAEIAAYKREHGLPVRDAAREEELLDALYGRASGEALGEGIIRLYKEMMAVSRDYQQALTDSGELPEN